MKPMDITGMRFGRLVAVKFIESLNGNAKWLFDCDCGSAKMAFANRVKDGRVSSCGCYRKEVFHGGTKTPEYTSWCAMRRRCLDKKQDSYHLYGGRGITICRRWDSFENFLADMGPKPTPKHSIERKDGNGNYEPSNCKWATKSEQCNNTTQNVLITHDGRTQTRVQWAREFGISYSAMKHRQKYGWSMERCKTPMSIRATINLSVEQS